MRAAITSRTPIVRCCRLFGTGYDERQKLPAASPETITIIRRGRRRRSSPICDGFDCGAEPSNHSLVIPCRMIVIVSRSEEHTSELQSPMYLVCRLLLEKKKKK